MDHFEYRDGSLFCEEVPVADVAARGGTPLYLYSTATLLHHYRALADAFAELEPSEGGARVLWASDRRLLASEILDDRSLEATAAALAR